MLTWITALVLACPFQGNVQPDYPAARQGEDQDEWHGRTIADPYRWLESMGPETRAWLRAQSSLLEESLGDDELVEAFSARVRALQQVRSHDLGWLLGERYFYQRDDALFVQEQGGTRLLLDPADFVGSDEEELRDLSFRPDGERLCFVVGHESDPHGTLLVMETATGEILPGEVPGVVGPALWASEGDGLFYVRDRGALGGQVVLRHRPGRDAARDEVVFRHPSGAGRRLTLGLTRAEDVLVVEARRSVERGTEVWLAPLAPLAQEAAEPRLLVEDDGHTYSFLGDDGGSLWLHTTRDAPRGRILAADVEAGQPAVWRVVVPEASESIAGNSAVGGNALGFFGGRFVVLYLAHNLPVVRIFDRDGVLEHEVRLPGIGSIWGGFRGSPEDPVVLFEFLGAADPGSIYRIDVNSGVCVPFRRSSAPAFSPDDYVTRQVFYESRDGTTVPMLVTHRRDLEADGQRPVWIYGFGAHGWVSFQWFQPRMIAWYDAGGIYATPGVRGGGEYGEDWHRAGIGVNKQNGVDDLIGAARWFVDQGLSRAGRIVAYGDGLGTVLAASAAMQRPELFGAAVLSIGPLDLLRHQVHTGAWTAELGSPLSEDEFQVLRALSPVHNIEPDRAYPPMLAQAGELDEISAPFHAMKFVAAMQAEALASRGPVLLQLTPGTGHGHGRNDEEENLTWSRWLAFAMRALDHGDEALQALRPGDARETALEITKLANEGFLMRSMDEVVLIDGFVEQEAFGYEHLDGTLLHSLVSAQAPFDDVDLALVSHAHRDHFQPRTALSFLKASRETVLASSPQILDAMLDEAARAGVELEEGLFEAFLPEAGQTQAASFAGVDVEFATLTHSPEVQHLAHVVRLGGVTVLHIGDADMTEENFVPLELSQRGVDVAFVPYWYFQDPEGTRIIREHLLPATLIACHVPPAELDGVVERLARDWPTALVPRMGETVSVTDDH